MLSVGYKLYRDVRDFAPQDWTPAERVVAWVIADDANDATRVSWIPNELLQARTGLSATGVRGALQRLASRGYEFRVCHGYGKDGRPVFATRKHAVDYLVPDVPAVAIGDTSLSPLPVDNPPETGPEPVDNPPEGDTRLSPIDRERRQRSDDRRHEAVASERERRHEAVAPPLKEINPHIPSVELPVVTTSVEGSKLSTGQERSSSPNGHHPSRLERAALRQVEATRALRQANGTAS